MNRRAKYALAVYLLGAAAVEAILIYNAISNGGIARLANKGAADILLTIAIHLAFSLLWPVLPIIAVLQYLGLLAYPFPH
jgi:hypothetical protein